jgi:hypothetical protein
MQGETVSEATAHLIAATTWAVIVTAGFAIASGNALAGISVGIICLGLYAAHRAIQNRRHVQLAPREVMRSVNEHGITTVTVDADGRAAWNFTAWPTDEYGQPHR